MLRVVQRRITSPTDSTSSPAPLTVLQAVAVSEKAAIARAVEENVWPLIAAGTVKPVIYRTFLLREAAAAHALMETSAHIGKIVLTV